MIAKRLISLAIVAGLGGGCSNARQAGARSAPRAEAPRSTSRSVAEADVEAIYEASRARHLGLTAKAFLEGLPDPKLASGPTFDPSTAEYYERVKDSLQLTPQEVQTFRRRGFVSVDHEQRYSFGAMYYAIYTRDLPVLITTDSILHAMHRSFDAFLQDVEANLILPELERMLATLHAEVELLDDSGVQGEARADLDVYLGVARSLLAGSVTEGAPPVATHSAAGAEVKRLLSQVASLQRNTPAALYGGSRMVDFSQFKPRGHYTKSKPLKRYFQAMMWMGRADTGFLLQDVDSSGHNAPDAARELRAAATLSQLMRETDTLQTWLWIDRLIGWLIGGNDNLTAAHVARALEGLRVSGVGDALQEATLSDLVRRVAREGKQRIRSQWVASHPADAERAPVPAAFQLFGQRFVFDSFALSKLVYDQIVVGGEKPMRMMPSGLDVMATLGNDHAARLLEPELERFRYAPNLVASREAARSAGAELWGGNVYHRWLDALRLLDDQAPARARFPSVMQSAAWQDKQLQTQLGSWAELRHDTILYAKQSYTVMALCEYPDGYVEPYPALYRAVAEIAETIAGALDAVEIEGDPGRQKARLVDGKKGFWKAFTTSVRELEALAEKELAGEPFTDGERAHLKQTIDLRGGGSGAPRYDGWYTRLFYTGGFAATRFDPTIADVHTDPNGGQVLHVGVGSAQFLAVAVDNEDDRAVYVGPAYSYYELTAGERLTDEQWQSRLQDNAPPRPAWTRSFTAKPQKRSLQR